MSAQAPNALNARIQAVREGIERAAQHAGRDPAKVTLLAVAKRKSATEVVAGVHAGLREIAENYAQEALAKMPEVQQQLCNAVGPRWHFVGRLQRNKARQVVDHFDVLHTLDRTALGDVLERRAAEAGRRLDVLLQADLCGEPQKGGAAPEALPELLEASLRWPHLQVRGLMTLPAAARNPEDSRAAFARLRALRDELRALPGGASLDELSMGMSADFEVAIQEGATIIRVGSAIFGPRDQPDPGRAA
ncbi:MAG: YggS family pyridoxal phosphate-dependent enzyme [Myxococcota bacterium]